MTKNRQTSISITQRDWKRLRNGLLTEDAFENAAVLVCGLSTLPNEDRLLVRMVLFPDLREYTERLPYHLEVSPRFYNSVIDKCGTAPGFSPVIVHSHPGSENASYSLSDNFGESRLLKVFEDLLPNRKPASLLITPSAVAGRKRKGRGFEDLQSLRIYGQTSRIIILDHRSASPQPSDKDRFDRQIRAFGIQGQQLIQSLRVAVVGLGGTGSVVAEQLVRAGVHDLLLIDPDSIEISNLNRLFGALSKHLKRRKTAVLGEHLTSIGAANVTTISDTALKQSVLLQMKDRDLIFSCVDNDLTRATLSRFSHQYLIPIVDVGIRLDARTGHMTAAAGRISVVGSGLICLRCSHHTSSDRIRAESLPHHERERLVREGYVMGIDDPVPAVVPLNVVVSGLGVTAGLNLFVELTGAPQPIDQIYDATAGIVFTSSPKNGEACDICDERSGVKALGDAQPVSAYD